MAAEKNQKKHAHWAVADNEWRAQMVLSRSVGDGSGGVVACADARAGGAGGGVAVGAFGDDRDVSDGGKVDAFSCDYVRRFYEAAIGF